MPFELDRLSEWFPHLVVNSLDEKSFCISGEIHAAATIGNFSINEAFSIKITALNYPESLPTCVETSGKVSDYHVNPAGEKDLCLASPIEIHRRLQKNPSIIRYITDLVIPFFVSFRYFEQHGFSPFGELAHGGKGLLSEYRLHFKVDDVTLCTLLTYGTKYLYRGHHPCPCGSGLLLRKCHGLNLRALFDRYSPALLFADILNCLDGINIKKHSEKHNMLRRRLKTVMKRLKPFITGGGKV